MRVAPLVALSFVLHAAAVAEPQLWVQVAGTLLAVSGGINMTSSHSRTQAHEGPRDTHPKQASSVAAALTKVPRDAFAPSPLSTSVIETMLSGLELQGTERVLCIGCAVGYPVALLSHLAHEVHAIEIEGSLLEPQRLALAQIGRTNLDMVHADSVRGRHLAAPFQAILVTAAAPELPPALIEQLAVGGRIVIPLGDEHRQLIELLEKRVDTLVSRTLGSTSRLRRSFQGKLTNANDLRSSDHGQSTFGMRSSGVDPMAARARPGVIGLTRASRCSGISRGKPMWKSSPRGVAIGG